MSHFAKIENGIVTAVIVAEQDFIDTQTGQWVQTSYQTYGNQHPENRPLRGNYAGIGFTYDAEHDVFYAQKPFPSWNLNRNTWLWEAPTPLPDSENFYKWNEESSVWIKQGAKA